jgi:hypothetical protein
MLSSDSRSSCVVTVARVSGRQQFGELAYIYGGRCRATKIRNWTFRWFFFISVYQLLRVLGCAPKLLQQFIYFAVHKWLPLSAEYGMSFADCVKSFFAATNLPSKKLFGKSVAPCVGIFIQTNITFCYII